jgi:hypothetical protein
VYSKFVKLVVKSPEEIYPTCLEGSGMPMGKFSIPPASKKVGWEKFLSHLPRWDRILAAVHRAAAAAFQVRFKFTTGLKDVPLLITA